MRILVLAFLLLLLVLAFAAGVWVGEMTNESHEGRPNKSRGRNSQEAHQCPGHMEEICKVSLPVGAAGPDAMAKAGHWTELIELFDAE